MKKILAICGSLRNHSSNERLLIAAKKIAMPEATVEIYRNLGSLPYFNPDLDNDNPPVPVRDIRNLVGKANGILISSPEYAHGVPGALKNALDWLVASVEFPGKPIILLCGGSFAPLQLEETLKTMSANVLRNCILSGPMLRKAFNLNGELIDSNLKTIIKDCLTLIP